MLNYFLKNGRIVDECDLHKAYEIVTGNNFIYDDLGFSKWLYSLLGNSIITVKKDEDMTVEAFLEAHEMVKAVRLYRNRNGGTLREAKDAVEQIAAHMRNE